MSLFLDVGHYGKQMRAKVLVEIELNVVGIFAIHVVRCGVSVLFRVWMAHDFEFVMDGVLYKNIAQVKVHMLDFTANA